MVEGIHAALVAFLRTSEHGVWTADTEQKNDEFNMRFIRGNWKQTLFGSKRVAGYGGADGDEKTLKPMLLSVTIRPAPNELRIGINHSVCYPKGLDRYFPLDVEKHTRFWQSHVSDEAIALSDYLHQFYSLERPPLIESV
jgi:hypothetical protein